MRLFENKFLGNSLIYGGLIGVGLITCFNISYNNKIVRNWICGIWNDISSLKTLVNKLNDRVSDLENKEECKEDKENNDN
jgi:hypothetical protein